MNINYDYDDELAIELVKYAKNFDTYEYNDIYNSDEDAFNDIKINLNNNRSIDSIIEWLCDDIYYFASEKDLENKEIYELSERAFNLLKKVNQYSIVLEKEDNKGMDM